MKPRHAAKVRLRRCACCQSKGSKRYRGRKYGNAIGRAADKVETRQQMKESAQ
jgi:hypothetical protein